MTIQNGGFKFSFGAAKDITPLGEEATKDHADLSLVDFVVELNDRYIFVEIVGAEPCDSKDDVEKFKSDSLCGELARKFRDSIFFHSFGAPAKKRVEYAVLYALSGIDDILLTFLQDELRRRIPLSHPAWNDDSVADCAVMNFDGWRKKYGEESLHRMDERRIKGDV